MEICLVTNRTKLHSQVTFNRSVLMNIMYVYRYTTMYAICQRCISVYTIWSIIVKGTFKYIHEHICGIKYHQINILTIIIIF